MTSVCIKYSALTNEHNQEGLCLKLRNQKHAFSLTITQLGKSKILNVFSCLSFIKNLLIELSIKFFKGGRNHGFDPSWRKLSINNLSANRAYFESWVKLLGTLLSTSQTLREFQDLRQGIRMGPAVLNTGSTYARLVWRTYSSRTT